MYTELDSYKVSRLAQRGVIRDLGLYSHSREYRKSSGSLVAKHVFEPLPPPSMWILWLHSHTPGAIIVFGGIHSVRMHAAHVSSPGRIQEKISG